MWSLFKPRSENKTARRLYDHAVVAARTPGFYTDLAVPDTLDGRFELIALHVFTLIFRLKNETGAYQKEADRLAQALFDVMFRDMDRSLREMGVGDLGVPRRVKTMMRAMNGRCHAYTQAIGAGDLTSALRRNVYGTVESVDHAHVAHLAADVTTHITTLLARSYSDLCMNESSPFLNDTNIRSTRAA